jgi:hypothetical protein
MASMEELAGVRGRVAARRSPVVRRVKRAPALYGTAVRTSRLPHLWSRDGWIARWAAGALPVLLDQDSNV